MPITELNKVDKKTKKLPDFYNKEVNGNFNRLFSMQTDLEAEFHNNLIEIFDSIDIRQAKNKTLDLLGASVGQLRGQLNDDEYRALILIKVIRNVGATDCNTIIDILSQMMGCPKNIINIQNQSDPATVEIEIRDAEDRGLLNNFSAASIREMLDLLMPVCVTIGNSSFEGTFEFGSADDTEGSASGFSSIDNNNIGGTLSLFIQ